MPNETQSSQPKEKNNLITILVTISLTLFIGIGAFASYKLLFEDRKGQIIDEASTPTVGADDKVLVPTNVVAVQNTSTPTVFSTPIPTRIVLATPTYSTPTRTIPTITITPTYTPTGNPSPTDVLTSTKSPTATPLNQETNLPDAGSTTYTLISLLIGFSFLIASLKILKS